MPVNVAKKNVTADGSMFGENKETLSSDAAPPAPSAPVASSKKKELSSSVKLYLTAYNVVLALGWLQVVILAVLEYASTQSFEGMWAAVELPLKIWQTAAFLEIAHVAIGLVPSSLFTTTVQVFSRVVVLWAVCEQYPEVPAHWSFFTMVLSWGITEVIRYSNYASDLLNIRPYALLWLRYTLFFVLYPSGAGSEMVQIYTALGHVVQDELFYVFVILIGLYIPLFPSQYFYMISQRKKQLGGDKDKKGKKAT